MSNGVKIPLKPLSEFTRTIGSFSQKLDECLNDMEKAIKTLGNDWKDDKYTEFQSEFTQHVKKIEPLSKELIRVKKHADEVWTPIIQEFLKNQVKK